ncbi:acetyl-CoA synthetase-like protein [Zopfia rhizophila CBS 207.26]|uniref:Acetyl-CoA synthetase-like protein n=1 Tax=Zopfia rhizophila CBS 207.26 TaxID=1314779 RepID=A0A6A6DCP4_9PEZI|nr:acetyl-CoA synthetase-like protein [Zopfia rhizophila CBS 207.26]
MDLSGLSSFPDVELLPTFLDRVASEDPSKVWISCPKDVNDVSKGFQDYTARELANYVNNAAWFLDEHLGKVREGKPPVVAYLGTADIRYLILPIALTKCGYETLPLSDLISADVRVYLTKEAGCDILVCAQGFGDDEVLSRKTMRRVIFPELHELAEPPNAKHYPYEKTPEEGLNDPFFILHTSGSSGVKGFPTIVRYPQGAASLNGLLRHIPDYDGLPNLYSVMRRSSRTYTGFRTTHAGGFFFAIRQIYQGVTIVTGGYNQDSIGSIEAAIDHGRIDSAALVPNSLKEISESPRMLEKLSKLKWVISSGTMLPQQVGDIISKKVHLINIYGSTEAISTTHNILPTEDWEYIHSNPNLSNLQFEESGENLFEAVYIKHPDPALRLHQGVFWCFPHLDRWSMGDLFSPHPTKKNAWKYVSRADDLIVMANGYKYLPTFFEQDILGKDPRIKSASIYGTAKEHLANRHKVMKSTTTSSTTDAPDPIVDEIWPVVQTVNDQSMKASQTSQILKRAVIIADPKRPPPRTGKGGVQKKLTEKLYQEELDWAFRT